ncbi:hypothetical protein IEQ34_017778 [Dendrobium chrysotoxum]|uniref:Uncharacterized protein n=1 Tax=Dendrobium chrysotoxum TaxID=161865 RepID=A0AAV7GCJ5_DENCH|nr:hypothetical protein IEQ34_017778 [Dendrobium chrysotoxum]
MKLVPLGGRTNNKRTSYRRCSMPRTLRIFRMPSSPICKGLGRSFIVPYFSIRPQSFFTKKNTLAQLFDGSRVVGYISHDSACRGHISHDPEGHGCHVSHDPTCHGHISL